jgi:hypothetical protein
MGCAICVLLPVGSCSAFTVITPLGADYLGFDDYALTDPLQSLPVMSVRVLPAGRFAQEPVAYSHIVAARAQSKVRGRI